LSADPGWRASAKFFCVQKGETLKIESITIGKPISTHSVIEWFGLTTLILLPVQSFNRR
jgi:hypothetical protein